MNFFEKIISGRLFSRRNVLPEPIEPIKQIEPEVSEPLKDGSSPQEGSTNSPKVEPLIPPLERRLPYNQEKLKKIDPEKRSLFHPQRGPGTIIKFFFMEKEYIVEDFNMNFKQDVDETKNIPGSLPYGGVMSITISEAPDYHINEWMVQSYLLRNGEIRFLLNKEKINESALLTIVFQDAYCVEYKKSMETSHLGILTTLVISPRTIKIGNEEFENSWKKQDDNFPYYIKSK